MYDKAVVEYQKVIDKNPNNFLVHFRLGNLYFMMKKIDQGVLHLQEVLKINKYNLEVDKIQVIRNLANAYLVREEYEDAFQGFLDILSVYPNDEEALYHVSFISLGQEFFDIASKHFDRLVKVSNKSFNIFFGAGMASFQEQKLNDAINYFREALKLDPESDLGNLCLSFALQKKSDFKNAQTYAKTVIEKTKDKTASIIAQRILGYITVRTGKPGDALKIFEDIHEYFKKNEMEEELAPILYDLGYVALMADKNEIAYDYWNQCYQYDRGYKNIQKLITALRKDMDKSIPKDESSSDSRDEYAADWQRNAFPDNFIWNICGLKSNYDIDLNRIRVTARVSAGKKPTPGDSGDKADAVNSAALERYHDLDVENFRIISNRVVQKLGYDVDEILNTYKEWDGVDFFAHSNADNSKSLFWVRRWKDTIVGEIPLRNLAQAINDMKANEGYFITSSSLSAPAEASLKTLSKVRVINPEQLSNLLEGLV